MKADKWVHVGTLATLVAAVGVGIWDFTLGEYALATWMAVVAVWMGFLAHTQRRWFE